MHRFFIPAIWIEQQRVTLLDDVAHQLKNVLRVKSGYRIVVLDNTGLEYEVLLTDVARNVVTGDIIAQRPGQNEPQLQVTLYQGTLKAQKFEWVLQKGTELGLSAFVPLVGERSVLSDLEAINHKRDRWQRIIKEAAEQSQRAILPKLYPAMQFVQICQEISLAANASSTQSHSPAKVGILAWENEENLRLKKALSQTEPSLKQINLLIGSEGGFTLDEVRLAHQHQITSISLGKRILRAETAGLIATSAIFYHFDQL